MKNEYFLSKTEHKLFLLTTEWLVVESLEKIINKNYIKSNNYLFNLQR